MSEDDTNGQTDREILIEVRTDQKWIKEKLNLICAGHKDHEERIQELELSNAKEEGEKTTKKESVALTIALIALVASLVSSAAAIIALFA